MSDYLNKILEEYEYQLDNSTDNDMNLFWQGAIFAIRVAILSEQAKEASK